MARVFLLTSPLVTNKRDLKKSAMHNGLLYMASWLLNRGHEAGLLHTEFEGWNKIRAETDTTKEFGLSDEEIICQIKRFGPDVIGLGLLATVSYGAFLKVARLIKNAFPKIPLVVGGAHCTALSEKTLRDTGVDYLVIGEGEVVMEKIVDNLGDCRKIQSISGVAYIDQVGSFKSNPRMPLISDLDEVGDLRLELIESVPFTKEPSYAGSAGGKKYIDVFFSRGCPLNCDFCFSPQLWLRKCRRHSLGWVKRQVSRMVEAGYGHLIVQDDNFSRMGEWSSGVMDIFSQAGVTWECNGGLEMEHLTPEKVREMSLKGATTLFIPLNFRTKKTNYVSDWLRDHYVSILKVAKDCGMYVYSSHIIGFPDQTCDGMIEQGIFARFLRMQGLSDFHVVYCYSLLPGTNGWISAMEKTCNGDYSLCADSGLRFEGGWDNWPKYSAHAPQIGTSNFTVEQLSELYEELVVDINGEEKAKIWFENQEWPK